MFIVLHLVDAGECDVELDAVDAYHRTAGGEGSSVYLRSGRVLRVTESPDAIREGLVPSELMTAGEARRRLELLMEALDDCEDDEEVTITAGEELSVKRRSN